MKKIKRILAVIGIIILVGLYAGTLILAITGNENTLDLLKTAIYATVVVPVLIWAYTFIYGLLKKYYSKKDIEDFFNDGRIINIDTYEKFREEQKIFNEISLQFYNYDKILINDLSSLPYATASKKKSIFEILNAMIYNNGQLLNGINLTCVPLYILNTNQVIQLKNNDFFDLNNQYYITGLNYSFNSNSMTINANEIPQEIYQYFNER